jgi:hypothetical protein
LFWRENFPTEVFFGGMQREKVLAGKGFGGKRFWREKVMAGKRFGGFVFQIIL